MVVLGHDQNGNAVGQWSQVFECLSTATGEGFANLHSQCS